MQAAAEPVHVLQAKEFGLDPVFTTHAKLFIKDVVNLESYARQPGGALHGKGMCGDV